MARLKEHYDTVVKPKLIEEFGYENPMQAPRLEKVVSTWVSARRSRTARS